MKKKEEQIVEERVKEMKTELCEFDGRARDWADSNLFKYVQLTHDLQVEGNKAKVKEHEFFNPEGLDVYREREVVCDLTLLKQILKNSNNENATSYHMVAPEHREGQSGYSMHFDTDMATK